MFLGMVTGVLVSTEKHPALQGRRLLWVTRTDPSGRSLGRSSLAVDSVDAGVGDSVLVLDEDIAFAIPKSVTFTPPSFRSIILAGLISLWMTSALWAKSRASATRLTMSRTFLKGRRLSFWINYKMKLSY